MSATDYKYWGFISYSHQDEAWAQWLHQSLEKYRVPRRLVGRALGDTIIPRRLFPIYRDREELSSAADLGAALNRALQQSRTLIVICSPRSATSRWVNEEIRSFREMGRGERIFCLIVDGEPHASEKPDIAFSECFPPALRAPSSDGAPFEPIAADARERKDGKANAKLKLLSGMLGVGFDELKQRDRQRQFWQRVQTVAATLALIGLLSSMWQWFQHKRAERERQITVEALVENGRQELLEGHQARAAVFLNEAYKMGDDSLPVRFMLGQAMQPIEALSKVRVRHGGADAFGATFSPDQSRFVIVANQVAGGTQASAKIYETASGRELLDLPGAPPWPSSVEFSPDGRYLLINGHSQTYIGSNPVTRVWDLQHPTAMRMLDGYNGAMGRSMSASGAEFLVASVEGLAVYQTATGHRTALLSAGKIVTAASFSPDGRWIGLAEADGRLRLYSAVTRQQVATLDETVGQNVNAILFSPDSRRVVAVSDPIKLHVWEISNRRLSLAFAPDSDWVSSIKFSRDGRRLLTVGAEGYKVWSAIRGSLLLMLQRPLIQVATADLSPDGGLLATADFANATSEVWDVLSKRKLYSLDYHTNGISSVAFDAAGRQLLLASRDRQAEIWHLPIAPLLRYESYATLPYSATFDRSGRHLMSGGGSDGVPGKLMLFDVTSLDSPRLLGEHRGVVRAIDESPDGRRLVSASSDGTAALWDVASGRRVAVMPHQPFEAYNARFDPAKGLRIVTTTNPDVPDHPDAAYLWDGLNGALVARLPHAGLVWAARFSSAGDKIVTASETGEAKIWSAVDGRFLRDLKGHSSRVTDAAFNDDGTVVATAGEDNIVRLWEVDTGRVISQLADGAMGLPTQVVFSPDAHEVAIASKNGNVWLWSPTSGQTLTLKGHQQAVRGVRFFQGGRLLLSYGDDGTARVWDPSDGRQLAVVAVHYDRVTSVAVSPDETSLASVNWSQLDLWRLGIERRSPDKLEAILRCRVPWRVMGSQSALTQAVPGGLPICDDGIRK